MCYSETLTLQMSTMGQELHGSLLSVTTVIPQRKITATNKGPLFKKSMMTAGKSVHYTE